MRISPYSIRMRENMDQINSKHEHFLRSDGFSLTRILPYNSVPLSSVAFVGGSLVLTSTKQSQ